MESDDDRFTLVESLTESQVVQLHKLVNQQWWAGDRSLNNVQLMLNHTDLMIGLIERNSDRLVGFCRALTDFSFRATIYDVMVAEDKIGTGLGKILMDNICNHPRLVQVEMINLCCEEQLFPFYERWGFNVCNGKAIWMVKTQSPRQDSD